MTARVAVPVLGETEESDALTVRDHSPPVSAGFQVNVPTQTWRFVSNTIGTDSFNTGLPLRSKYAPTDPDCKTVPSGYVIDALKLICCPTTKLVPVATFSERAAGFNCVAPAADRLGPLFPYASLYANAARFAVQVPVWLSVEVL